MQDNQDKPFIRFLPYFGPYIIFLGVTRLLFYYSSFGVTITNFLEFSEIITSFLDILAIIVIQFVFGIIQSFLMKSKKEIDEENSLREKLLDEANFFIRLKLYCAYYYRLIFNTLGMLLIVSILSFFSKNINYTTIIYLSLSSLSLFIYAIIVVEVDVKHKLVNSSDKDKQFSGLLLYSLLFIGLTLTYSYSQVENVKVKKTTFGTSIILEDNTILVSDSSNYFIGKTQGYIFFYHEATKSTDIIPVSKLKKMTINENNRSL